MKVKNDLRYKLLLTLICGVAFFCVCVPFRSFFQFTSMTELRPAAILPPVCSLFFGFWGALGCSLGNLAGDIVFGLSAPMCVESFFIQLFTSYIVHHLWYSDFVVDKDISLYPRFDKISKVIRFGVIVLISSLLNAGLLGFMIMFNTHSDFINNTTLIIFFNNLDFGVLLGIPFVAFLSKKNIRFIIPKNKAEKLSNEQKDVASFNEKMIYQFMCAGLIFTAIITVFCYFFLSAVVVDDIKLWETIYIFAGVVINLYIIIIARVLLYTEKSFVIPIKSISTSISEYGTDGNFDNKAIINECKKFADIDSEVGNMAKVIEKMLTDIEVYTDNIKKSTAEREKMVAELNVASKIQRGILPKNFDELNKFNVSVSADMTPAKMVGGDFYDCFAVDNEHMAVVIADVSGKGVPAAMFMAMTKVILHMFYDSGKTPSEILTKTNEVLCSQNDANMFVTAFIGLLNIKTGEFIYSNAGHNAPLLMRNNKEFDYVKIKPGFVLAGIDDFKYKEFSTTLNKGDTVVLYTDGVTEANSATGNMYGEERLKNILNENKNASVKDLVNAVENSVSNFADGQEQFDDLTLLALRIE